MRKLLATCGALAAFCGAALAQGVTDTYVTVAFGKVRGADGRMHDIKGLRLPVKSITKLQPGGLRPASRPWGGPPMMPATAYLADAGSGYGIVDGNFCPSAVDDMTLAGGAGLPWQQLTFGMNIAVQRDVVVRWIVYDTFVGGRGANVQAFDTVLADFGVIWPASMASPGTVKTTIDVSAAGVSVPNTTIYVAQQFRARQFPIEHGEGPFVTSTSTVFNSAAAPNIGSSDNNFWYDSDPPNGIYDETEFEQFDGSFANFLFGIVTGGTQDNVFPINFSMSRGTSSGDLDALWFDDSVRLLMNQSAFASTTLPAIEITSEGTSPSANINSLKISLELSATNTGVTQKVQIFNWNTSAFEDVDTRNAAISDTLIEKTFTNLPSKYVNPTTRRMRVRVSWKNNTPFNNQWTASIDRITFTVTRP